MYPDVLQLRRKRYIIGACVLAVLLLIGLIFKIFSLGSGRFENDTGSVRLTSIEREKIAESLRTSPVPTVPLTEADRARLSQLLRTK